jgi:hypothetical protein
MPDLSRFSLKPIVVKHFEALRPSGSTQITLPSKIVLFVVPLIFSGLGVALGYKLDRGGATALLTATGLLAGAMVTGFIFLANLRIKISESEQLKLKRKMSLLTSETAVACLYCAGLALGIAVTLAASLAAPRALRPDWAHLVVTALLVFALVHLSVNFLTVLRRLFGVYYDVFKSDFVKLADVSGAIGEGEGGLPSPKTTRTVPMQRQGEG